MKNLAAIFLCLLGFGAAAQEYNFKVYSVPQGLGHAQVTDMAQDQYGQLWFATYGGGVSLFNGRDFKVYNTDNGLGGNFSNCIEIWGDSTWVGGDEGLTLISRNGLFNYTTQHGLISDTILVIKRVDDQLWISTPHGFQVGHFQDQQLRFTSPKSISQVGISFIEHSRNGNVWLGYTNSGLSLVDHDLKVIKKYSKANGITSPNVRCLAESSGFLAVGTYGRGIQIVKPDTFFELNSNSGFPDDVVLDLRLESGFLYAATQSHGVLKIETDSFEVVQRLGEENGLPSDFITSTLRDKWGNNWYATLGRGVARHYAPEIVHHTDKSGMPNDVVLSIYHFKDSSTVISTKESQLALFVDDSLQQLDLLEDEVKAPVRCFLMAQDSSIWMGTDGGGIYTHKKGVVNRFGREDGLTFRWIKDLVQDANGTIWIGTLGGGTYFYRDGDFTSMRRKFRLQHERTECLELDNKNRVWVGTRKYGVMRVDGKEASAFTEMGLGSVAVRDIKCDAESRAWVGTARGLYLIENETIRQFSKENGLVSGNIYSVECHDGFVFLGTDRGVTQLQYQNGDLSKVYHHGYEQGLTGVEAMQGALHFDHLDRLWVGTVSGLSILDYKARPQNDLTTIPVFKRTQLFEQTLTDSILKAISEKNGDKWVFSHDQNAFTFEFAGINQFEPNGVRYRWRLDGYEDEYTTEQPVGRATYSRLPPGEYTFQFMAGSSGVWGTPVESFHFSISQPYWKTPWFIMLVILASVFVVGGAIYLRIRNIRLKSERVNEKLRYKNQVLALEAKALQLQMNPHFMFNALNSVKGLIAVNDLKSAKLYLARFAKLMRRILENSRDPFVSVQSELEMMDIYLQLENQALEKTFEYHITVGEELDSVETLVPPMLLQPFVENAVKHAMRYKEGDGRIDLKVSLPEADVVVFEVLDNGPGRTAVREKQLAEQKHRSMALEITTERLKSFGDKYGVSISDLEINENLGTQVILKVPGKHL